MSEPKILFLDIETSFKIAGVWGRWGQNISMNQLIQDSHVLCWAAAWVGEDDMLFDSLHYHKRYAKDPTDDREILKSAWKLLDEADFVVAHNGARFDIPVLNARFLRHGMQPPSTYRVIDTLKTARREFRLTSNRLDDLGEYLKVGRKLKTDFGLWVDVVLRQDREAFDRMVDYCVQDTELLERVYHKLAPWDSKHPSVTVFFPEAMACNVCGSPDLKRNGSYATNTQVYQKYKCKSCGHNMRSRKAEPRSKGEKRNVLRST